MAFLDNSGDIILDAVLTDTGRMRLSKGDGSFRIAKFALGDDEIDYSLYNSSHASGTAYFDLEILQTPVLEAFSNNASSMKSKLISIARNNLLYLPVIKLDTISTPTAAATDLVNGGFILAVDKDTEDTTIATGETYNTKPLTSGVLYGLDKSKTTFIQVLQGLDTTETGLETLDADLTETQYLVEIDNRIAGVCDLAGNPATPSYIDDDNIATYYFSRGVDTAYVEDFKQSINTNQVIAGPRGTLLKFKLLSHSEVSISDYLFNSIGKDISSGWTGPVTVTNARGILTNIRVTGVTTGNVIDIPLMAIKKIS